MVFPVIETFGLDLCKTFRRDEAGAITCTSYDNARTFRYQFHPIGGLEGFFDLQAQLQRRRCSAHVRAALRAGVDPHRMERRLHRRVEADGRVREPTMVDVPRSYVLFDLDGVSAPDDWHHHMADFARMMVQDLFPAAFHGVGFVAVATASAAMKPGARLRLGFLLDHPRFGHEVERAVAGTPIDPSTLRPVQLVYTAAPTFHGIQDPIVDRVVLVPGDRDAVPLVVPPELPRPTIDLNLARSRQDGEDGLALARLAAAVASAPQGSRHRKLYGCAWRAAELVLAGQATPLEVFDALGAAAVRAGLADPPTEIARIIRGGLEQGIGSAA
jgi:hypothetical protein